MHCAVKHMRRENLIYVALLVITLIGFWPAGRLDFILYDDWLYVYKNANVQAGVTAESIHWAFTTMRTGNWHPVTWVSHMLDCQLFGLNAHGHHWTSLGFHLANTLLLFLILKEMTGALWRSAMVAALFAWHPLQVESVAWISERKDVLSGFFFLLTLWAYARYVQSKSKVQSPKSTQVFLRSGVVFFALGIDEQADAGDAAVCAVAAGLLAAGQSADGGWRMAESKNNHSSTTWCDQAKRRRFNLQPATV